MQMMMNKLATAGETLLFVLFRKKYFLLTLLFSFAFFVLNVYAPNLGLLFRAGVLDGKFSLFASLFVGGVQNIQLLSRYIFIVLSLLFGILLSLFIFRVHTTAQILGGKKSSIIGTIVAVLVPTCASCGVGLAYVLGFGGVAVFLPFRGLELGFLGILLLGYAVYSASLSLFSCTSR